MKNSKNLKKLFLVLTFAMTMPILAFSSQYISKTDKILSTSGKDMGVIYKGTKVDKIGQEYQLTGWVMDGNEYIIFYSKDERIKLARIDRTFIKNQTILDNTKDVYDVKWKKVSLSFKTKNKNLTVSNNKKLWTQESDLYQRCGSCHSLHPYNEFNANQWPAIVKTMQNNAGFSKKEAKNISIFLQYQSLKGNSHE